MAPQPPLIAILTDFGDQDWYVASMKAVIARLCPEARAIDITHKVEAGNTRSAAFILSQCYDDFPRGTVFLCVVDPGVGSQRAPIILYDGDYCFVAPDNGLLSLLKPGLSRSFRVDIERLRLQLKASQTFHGRDVFAPAAALLASGRKPIELGQPLPGLSSEGYQFPAVASLPCAGSVIYFDHYGNAISNLKLAAYSPSPDAVALESGERIPFRRCYSDVPANLPVAYLGSGGFVEIAVNQGNARISLDLDLESDFRLL